MRNWKRILFILGAVIFSLAVLILVIGIVLTNFLVDLWWFFSLDYGGYFWLRLLYRYIFSGGIILLFFLIFFFNFWIASRYLGIEESAIEKLDKLAAGKKYKSLLKRFQTGSMEVYTPLSLILAIAIAVPFYDQWEAALLFFFGRGMGVDDPVYGNDVSFYLFYLPIFLLIQELLLIVFSVLFVSITLLYWLENHLLPVQKRIFPFGAKIHLTLLILMTILIVGWGFMLDRFSLLYTDANEPVFFGPGFVEIRYQLPLIWLSLLTFLGAALSAVLYAHRRNGLGLTVGFTLCFLLVLGLRKVEFVPDLLHRFVIQPNPVTTQRPFIRNNIEATLEAYDLSNKIKEVDFTASLSPEEDISGAVEEFIANIPVWDEGFLDDVYQQLQGLRPYYHFSGVDVARYPIKGRIQQVNLSARELNIAKLPEAAKTWENQHLRYTHGYGVVITPAAQQGGQPMQWYMRDLNLLSPVGFNIERPDIYYGEENLEYAIVPNKLEIVDISATDLRSSQEYYGQGGVELESLFRKLIFAIFYNDPKIFFSINIANDSRIRYRRNIIERLNILTPYLTLDNDPYIVVTPEKFYWIVDAYTTSDWYPVSESTVLPAKAPQLEEKRERFNYIRNSVKVVIDAYDGRTDFYIADPKDPIVQAYRRAYPGVFKPMEEMPSELKSQLRYPRDFFRIQMQMYSRYHQKAPALFYQQAETWNFPRIQNTMVKPYFLTVNLQACPETREFVQISPMTPVGRDNLSALGIAGTVDIEKCGAGYAPNIVVYKFRKDIQVDGPAQVDALIEQDPEISAQFTLWGMRGSRVNRGRIIVLPIGNSMVYVQPVYLIAAGRTKIPELIRVIISVGNMVVMRRSLEEAFDELRARLIQQREPGEVPFPPPEPAPSPIPESIPEEKKQTPLINPAPGSERKTPKAAPQEGG